LNPYKTFHTLIFWLLLFFSVNAQNPHHFNISELYNFNVNTIYTIHQAENNYVWIGSDQGLYRYSGTDFRAYTNSNYQTEYSYIKEDSEGRIWCANFSGQIFYVSKNQKLTLFKDFSKSSADGLISFSLDRFPEIYVATDRGYEVINFYSSKKSSNIKDKFYFNQDLKREGYRFLEKPFQIYFLSDKLNLSTTEKVIEFDENNLNVLTSINETIIRAPFVTIHKDQSATLIYNTDSNTIVKRWDDKKLTKYILNDIPTVNESAVYYDKDNQTFWLGTIEGIYVFDKNFRLVDHFLEDFNISYIIKDHENNHWAGTLNKGILVIPNLKIKTFSRQLKNKGIEDISVYKNELYILTDDSYLFKYTPLNKKIELLSAVESRAVKLIFNPFLNVFHLGNSKSVFDLNSQTTRFNNLDNIKHLEKINDSSCIINSSYSSVLKNFSSYKTKLIRKKRSFGTCVINENKFYIAHSDGLYKYNKNKAQKLVFKKAPLLVNYAMLKHPDKENTIWAFDNKGKLFIINDEEIKLIHSFNTTVNNFKFFNNFLFIATKDGIYKYDIIKKTQSLINHTDGLPENNVSTIEIIDNTIFAVTNEGLVQFNSDYDFVNTVKPEVNVRRVLVNKKVQKINSVYNLNYDENNINIRLNTYCLRSQRSYKFLYRFQERDSTWRFTKNNKIDFYALQPGQYNLEILAVNEDNVKTDQAQLIQFNIDKPYNQKWWFYLLFFIGATSWIILFFYQIIKKKNIEKQLIYSSITSLKAQMNPHFLFNAINTIQYYILKSNKEKAYDYLTKLSFLIRENLDMSEKAFVSLSNEIELSSTYLELEKIRFKDDFKYEIVIDNSTNPNEIKIPSMVIQPFIENAIKHGLMHKEGNKSLKIEFKKMAYLECKITDNGIGRKAAKLINENKSFHGHESFSTKTIKKRFELLKAYYNLKLGFWYEDIESGGTTVKINIPIES
jgi:ligand-binding sensor domain-containing protein